MEKKTVAVVFGGQSSEHEISVLSVQTVVAQMDPLRYDTLLIGITKDGRWLKVDSLRQIEDGTWQQSSTKAILVPDAQIHGILLLFPDGTVKQQRVDVVFPVLHGLCGEDGTIQGLLELSRIPYVGCGVLSSSVAMDKLSTKCMVQQLGIAQARYVAVMREELTDGKAVLDRVEQAFPYPVFVKPSNAGSSRGVTRAGNRDELKKGLALASQHDRRILVEEAILGRELECAVIGTRGNDVTACGVGEILAAAVFYDYDAKYNSAESRTDIAPVLPVGKKEEIERDAVRIFQALDGFGLARVDFFLETKTNRVIFNEINTLPGFTQISMYPMLCEGKGYAGAKLWTKLIEMADERERE